MNNHVMEVVEPSEIIIDRDNPFQQDASKINPWVRVLARFTDYSLFSLFLILIEFFFFPQFNWKRVEFLISIEFLLWIPIEAFFISQWQFTIGKWLLKTKIKNEKGGRFPYKQSIYRAFSVWCRGMGMGIPIISLITMLVSYSRLKVQGKTSWDEEGQVKVVHSPIERFRLVIAMGIIFVSLVLNIYQRKPGGSKHVMFSCEDCNHIQNALNVRLVNFLENGTICPTEMQDLHCDDR